MTIAKGDHLAHVDGNGLAQTDPATGEAVTFEILEALAPMNVHDAKTGQFTHEAQVLVLKRIDSMKEIEVPVTETRTVPANYEPPTPPKRGEHV